MPSRRTLLWFLAILLANFLLIQLLRPGGETSITVPYTFFKEEVSKGNVEAIYSRGDTLTGRFKTPVTWPPSSSTLSAITLMRPTLPPP